MSALIRNANGNTKYIVTIACALIVISFGIYHISTLESLKKSTSRKAEINILRKMIEILEKNFLEKFREKKSIFYALFRGKFEIFWRQN